MQRITADNRFWNRSKYANGSFEFYDVPAPGLRVQLGEIFDIETVNTCDVAILSEEDMRKENGAMAGNPWTGPVYVEGICAGDVISVTIHDLEVVGHSFIGPGNLLEAWTDEERKSFIKIKDGHALFPGGWRVPIHPRYGCFGVVPSAPNWDPWKHGGNLDIPEIRAGTTVHVRCERDGAYFGCGDGHALQGEGEISGWAVETALVGRISIARSEFQYLDSMLLETDEKIIAVGVDEDFDTSAKASLLTLSDHLSRQAQVSRMDAYELTVQVGDLRLGAAWPMRAAGNKIPVPVCVHLDRAYFSIPASN